MFFKKKNRKNDEELNKKEVSANAKIIESDVDFYNSTIVDNDDSVNKKNSELQREKERKILFSEIEPPVGLVKNSEFIIYYLDKIVPELKPAEKYRSELGSSERPLYVIPKRIRGFLSPKRRYDGKYSGEIFFKTWRVYPGKVECVIMKMESSLPNKNVALKKESRVQEIIVNENKSMTQLDFIDVDVDNETFEEFHSLWFTQSSYDADFDEWLENENLKIAADSFSFPLCVCREYPKDSPMDGSGIRQI